jgi:hypothetical protein
VANHRHAVNRDLCDLGYRGRDALIDPQDFVSIISASPPGSAVKHFAVDEGWPQSDQLLANLAEQQAGLTELPTRYARPGVEEPVKPGPVAMTREEFDKRHATDLARGDQLAASEKSSAMKKGIKGVDQIV